MRVVINGFILADDYSSARKGSEFIKLTAQEMGTIRIFVESPDGFAESGILEAAVWGDRIVTHNSLRKLISGLRIKFQDKDAFRNVRGKGYKLEFQNLKPFPVKPLRKFSPLRIATFLLSMLVLVFAGVSASLFYESSPPQLTVSPHKVFESDEYILDYDIYDTNLYVTTRGTSDSSLYRVKNRNKIKLAEADFPGAFRGIEINETGKTILHVIENAECKIKIYEKPVSGLISELPCNRQNAFPSFDWLDNDRFLVTFNLSRDSSISPYIYDLKSETLEKTAFSDASSDRDSFFIDVFIKAKNDGIFTLRENHLDQMSLVYLEGDQQQKIYDYRAKPYSFGLADDALYLMSNDNSLLKLELKGEILDGKVSSSVVLPPQANKIDDPLILNGDLYFSLGNTSREVIKSLSGKFNYSLENGIRDFSYTGNVLSILALTNNGYVIEQLKDEIIFNSIYINSDLNFRHIAFHQGEIYLAGGSGIFKIINDAPVLLEKFGVKELASNDDCMLAEAAEGIYRFDNLKGEFSKLASQGERIFPGKSSCFFVDNLTNFIVDEDREKRVEPRLNKLIFEHQGELLQWHHVHEQTHFVNIETGETVASTEERVLYKRVVSYKDDILFLGHADVNTSILKIDL